MPSNSTDPPDVVDRLGPITSAAVTLYVDDLDTSIAWYRDALGLEPATVSEDAFRYAGYRAGGLAFVLEPASAATDPRDSDRTGAAALNLVVDRDPEVIRSELTASGVACTEVKRSPGFDTFLVRDPDGHRIYVTRARA